MSGSMCVTEPVKGNFGFKTNRLNDLKKQLGPQEGSQYLPKEKKNVTYVSRLECVQAAIEVQLTELQRNSPNKKIGLITFNDEVYKENLKKSLAGQLVSLRTSFVKDFWLCKNQDRPLWALGCWLL